MQITTSIVPSRARPSAHRVQQSEGQSTSSDSVSLNSAPEAALNADPGRVKKALKAVENQRGALLAGAVGASAGVVLSLVSSTVGGALSSLAAPILGLAGLFGGVIAGAHSGLSLSQKLNPDSLGLLDSALGAGIGAIAGAAAGFLGGGLLASSGGLGTVLAGAATLGTAGAAGALALSHAL